MKININSILKLMIAILVISVSKNSYSYSIQDKCHYKEFYYTENFNDDENKNGIRDICEKSSDQQEQNNDLDDDGFSNEFDNCPEDSNPDQLDSDLDGIGDVCDLDDDNDGILDEEDNCILIPNFGQGDVDRDGLGNECDDDDDGDGFLDEEDNCDYIPNSEQIDRDGDGEGWPCDHDDDGDDLHEKFDNCPFDYNPHQENYDGDAQGDICDDDDDNDGVNDEEDNCLYLYNPNQLDNNENGIGDLCEDRVFANEDKTCFIYDSGRLKCWGQNRDGDLGQGHVENIGDDPNEMGENLPYIDLGEEELVKQVGIGNRNICALLESNQVKCWGSGLSGLIGDEGEIIRLREQENLGDEPNEMGENLPVIDFGTDEEIKKLVVGLDHACVLFESGRIKCWGNEVTLGDGIIYPRIGLRAESMGENLPYINLGENLTAVDIAIDNRQTCALFDDGRTKCWGSWIAGDPNLFIGLEESGDDIPFVDHAPLENHIKSMELKNKYLYFHMVDSSLHVINILNGQTFRYRGEFVKDYYIEPIALGLGRGLALTANGLKSMIIDIRDPELPDITMNDEVIDTGSHLDIIDMSTQASRHGCIFFQDESMKCFGDNNDGELGYGNNQFVHWDILSESPFLNL